MCVCRCVCGGSGGGGEGGGGARVCARSPIFLIVCQNVTQSLHTPVRTWLYCLLL